MDIKSNISYIPISVNRITILHINRFVEAGLPLTHNSNIYLFTFILTFSHSQTLYSFTGYKSTTVFTASTCETAVVSIVLYCIVFAARTEP